MPKADHAAKESIATNASWAALVSNVVFVAILFAVWLFSQTLGNNYGHHNSTSPIGWSAAILASLGFGMTEVPLKLKAAATQGSTLFNAYSAFATGMCNCLFFLTMLLLRMQFHWHWLGAFAAVNLIITQHFARKAVLHLGISAMTIWSTVGIGTSFAWGTLVFGDQPRHFFFALVGLFITVVGISLTVVAFAFDDTEESTPDTVEVEEQTPLVPARDHKGSFVAGTAYGVVAGLADGSLVAFYQALDTSSVWSPDVMFSYFCSFGAAMMVMGVFLLGSVLLMEGPSKTPMTPSALMPGMMSGAMWALGNSCSVLASHFLGMSLSFPLAQTCCAVSALIGVLIFGELKSHIGKQSLALGMAVGAFGVALLAINGRQD